MMFTVVLLLFMVSGLISLLARFICFLNSVWFVFAGFSLFLPWHWRRSKRKVMSNKRKCLYNFLDVISKKLFFEYPTSAINKTDSLVESLLSVINYKCHHLLNAGVFLTVFVVCMPNNPTWNLIKQKIVFPNSRTHKAGRVQFLSPGQVSDVISVVVDALHAAFEVSLASWDGLARVGHSSKTQLGRKKEVKMHFFHKVYQYNTAAPVSHCLWRTDTAWVSHHVQVDSNRYRFL